MLEQNHHSEQTAPEASHGRQPTGHWVVCGMFAFGLLMVGLLWGYWELYTRPFRPLQYAIADQYPGSSPRVIGGRHKSHQTAPPATLRIVTRIPQDNFNPADPEETGQCEQRALELARLAAEHDSFEGYALLDVHLIQRVPEQSDRRWSVSREIEEWEQLLERN